MTRPTIAIDRARAGFTIGFVIEPCSGAIPEAIVLDLVRENKHIRFPINTRALHVRLGEEPVLFAGTSVGVHAALVRGVDTAWARYGVGLPDTSVTDLQLHPTYLTLAAATYGRGAFIVATDDAELSSVRIRVDTDACGVGAVEGGVVSALAKITQVCS